MDGISVTDSSGGTLSWTVTDEVQADVFPDASVAVKVTAVTPTG